MKNKSLLYDFHGIIGQYIDYRGILKDENIDQELFLAIPEESYALMQKRPFYGRRIADNQIKLIIVDILNEVIAQWIK
jgi:XisH protein